MRSKFTRDVSTTLATRVLSFGLGIVSSIFIARALQPAGKGLYATVLATVDTATMLGSMGLSKAVIYCLGRKNLDRSCLAGTVEVLAVINGSLAMLIVAVSAFVVRRQVLGEIAPSTYLLALPLAFVGVLFNYAASLLRGEQRIFDCNRATMTQPVVFLAVAGALALIGLNPTLAVLALLLASLCATGAALLFVNRAGLLVRPAVDIRIIRALAGYGLVYQIYSFLQLMHYRFDIFLVGHFTDAANVGYYSTAVNVAQLVWNMPMAITFVLVPWVANRRKGEAEQGTAAAARYTLALMVLLAAGLGLLATPLVRLAYGIEYLPAVVPLRALLPGIVMNGLVLVLGGHLIGQGELRSLILISATGLVANMALNVWWLPVYGIVGSAWASSVTYSLVGTLALLIFLRSGKGSVRLSDVIIIKRADVQYVLQPVRRALSPKVVKDRCLEP